MCVCSTDTVMETGKESACVLYVDAGVSECKKDNKEQSVCCNEGASESILCESQRAEERRHRARQCVCFCCRFHRKCASHLFSPTAEQPAVFFCGPVRLQRRLRQAARPRDSPQTPFRRSAPTKSDGEPVHSAQ